MMTTFAAYKRNQTLQFVWTGVETNVTDVSTLAFALDTIYCTPSLQGSTPQQLAQVRMLLLAVGSQSSAEHLVFSQSGTAVLLRRG